MVSSLKSNPALETPEKMKSFSEIKPVVHIALNTKFPESASYKTILLFVTFYLTGEAHHEARDGIRYAVTQHKAATGEDLGQSVDRVLERPLPRTARVRVLINTEHRDDVEVEVDYLCHDGNPLDPADPSEVELFRAIDDEGNPVALELVREAAEERIAQGFQS